MKQFYKFENNPFLPRKKISAFFCDPRICPDIQYAIESMGIKVIKLNQCKAFDEPVSGHPDMLLSIYGTTVYVEKSNYEIVSQVFGSEYEINSVDFGEEKCGYPKEASLNGYVLNDYLICREKSFLPAYGNIRGIINTTQGYAKCASCVVDDNSIITEDSGIYKVCVKEGIEVLLLSRHAVALKGYSHGFIGGAAAKVDRDTIAFCGSVEAHPEFTKIKRFLEARCVGFVSLSDKPLYDYGSLLGI